MWERLPCRDRWITAWPCESRDVACSAKRYAASRSREVAPTFGSFAGGSHSPNGDSCLLINSILSWCFLYRPFTNAPLPLAVTSAHEPARCDVNEQEIGRA